MQQGQANASRAEQAGAASPLQGLVIAMGGLGIVERLFARLDTVAPDDIEPDVAKVHEVIEQQLKISGGSIGEMFGNLFGGLLQGIVYQESFNRVDVYSKANCAVTL